MGCTPSKDHATAEAEQAQYEEMMARAKSDAKEEFDAQAAWRRASSVPIMVGVLTPMQRASLVGGPRWSVMGGSGKAGLNNIDHQAAAAAACEAHASRSRSGSFLPGRGDSESDSTEAPAKLDENSDEQRISGTPPAGADKVSFKAFQDDGEWETTETAADTTNTAATEAESADAVGKNDDATEAKNPLNPEGRLKRRESSVSNIALESCDNSLRESPQPA